MISVAIAVVGTCLIIIAYRTMLAVEVIIEILEDFDIMSKRESREEGCEVE